MITRREESTSYLDIGDFFKVDYSSEIYAVVKSSEYKFLVVKLTKQSFYVIKQFSSLIDLNAYFDGCIEKKFKEVIFH